jgi:hypothetical protein
MFLLGYVHMVSPVAECPHSIVGIIVTGSGDCSCDNRSEARLSDVGIHSCPHCGIGICITASSSKTVNNRGAHRQGDLVLLPGGIAITVTSSNDCTVD